MIMKKFSSLALLLTLSFMAVAQSVQWPDAQITAKPGTRWWWPGSAVDSESLELIMNDFARTGIGTVEITPIYGAQGNDANGIDYLSPRWMEALRATQDIARRNGQQVDMNNGTGWPFGGPEVTLDDAAKKALFVDTIVPATAKIEEMVFKVPAKDQKYATLIAVREFPIEATDTKRVIAVYQAPTRQKVKRAAPGGEGYVIDHFDAGAVSRYLDRFDRAFAATATPWPTTMFNDSYEVYGANWTPSLFDEFARRRGYRLEDRLPELLGDVDDGGKTLHDYRETLSDLLYENFTRQWVAWAHSHGALIRNQAHGSPANLLDLYGEVDIPEIEGFGLSELGIKGLRTDPGNVKKNDSDITMMKYAPSAAHVTGHPLASSETFTWLTEHFRTSLSQMKPDLDLLFTAGVNRVFFHGSCYSPKEVAWPGWRFYASVDMTPNNTIWRDAPELMKYIERTQSFLQMGSPDNDFLVYLPVHDMWRGRHSRGEKGLLMMFAIHSMEQKAPQFIKSILRIDSLGYDCDYISDRQLARTRLDGDALVTEGGTRYRGLIIPSGATVTPELQAIIDRLGDRVVFGEAPADLGRLSKAEPLRASTGLRAIRRSNPTGHHYFVANLSPDDVSASYPLAVDFADAAWFNPLDGSIERAEIVDGKVLVDLRSGESRVLQTYASPLATDLKPRQKTSSAGETLDLTDGDWTLSFVESAPAVPEVFKLKSLQNWENLSDSTRVLAGTGVYSRTFKLDKRQAARPWRLDLGDVRESARVYVNGRYAGTVWAAPFTLDLPDGLLKKGRNEIRLEVTNLPANRIADYDRRAIPWRNMKEINVVDLRYKKTTYEGWEPVPSGLSSLKLVSR